MLKASLVFALTYVLIASRRLRLIRLDRAAGALLGAVLAVSCGVLSPQQAIAAIDLPTLTLLLGVMGIAAFLAIDGFVDRLAPWIERRVRTPQRLLAILVWGSGCFSALLTNDALCLLVAAPVVQWIRRWGLPRLPFLVALATASNTGGVATLIGNPQNMLCATFGKLEFAGYLGHVLPIALLSLAFNHAFLAWIFRRDLRFPLRSELPGTPSLEQSATPLWSPAARWIFFVLAASILACLLGANLPFTLLFAFVSLMVILRREPEELWQRIDWSVLLFFAGLFVAVEGFTRSGVPASLLGRLHPMRGEPTLFESMRTAWVFLFGSNLVTNVPFILLLRGWMQQIAHQRWAWEMLAVVSTFAGNLTLLGSVANLIVAEKSLEVGGLGFLEHFKIAAPIALGTTLIGTLWLYGTYF